jgi:uncharacterized membrane protein
MEVLAMLRFLKTTVFGGILFLVPIVIFIAIIGKALQITNKLAIPIAGLLGIDKIIGIAVAELLSIGILVMICFIAGLAAKTPRAKKFVQSLEVNVLEKIPAYELLKAKTQSALSFEETEGMSPIMARFDDSWQLAFEIERIEGGNVVIFLPGAPEPWSGSVCVVTEDRITPLNLKVKSVVNLMKRLGKGSIDALPNPQVFSKASI